MFNPFSKISIIKIVFSAFKFVCRCSDMQFENQCFTANFWIPLKTPQKAKSASLCTMWLTPAVCMYYLFFYFSFFWPFCRLTYLDIQTILTSGMKTNIIQNRTPESVVFTINALHSHAETKCAKGRIPTGEREHTHINLYINSKHSVLSSELSKLTWHSYCLFLTFGTKKRTLARRFHKHKLKCDKSLKSQ